MFKAVMKAAAVNTAGLACRFLPPLRRMVLGRFTVFVFHDVTDRPSTFTEKYGLAVSSQTFRSQIDWIEKNYDIIGPDELDKATGKSNACLITFDDGFRGAFDNGVPYLVERGIPSLHFLNMSTILERKPMLSARACYLDETSDAFKSFCRDENISLPSYLNVTPKQFDKFRAKAGSADGADSDAYRYQGDLVSLETLKIWADHPKVWFGNHLFDHWNCMALTKDELVHYYNENRKYLQEIQTRVELFSFTNGQPGTCFDCSHVEILKELGAERVFFSHGNSNSHGKTYALDRKSLFQQEGSTNRLYFRFLFDALRRLFKAGKAEDFLKVQA